MYVGCNNAQCVVSGSIIENNWIHDSLPGSKQGDGIEVKVGSHSNVIRGNVIYNMSFPGIVVYGTQGNPRNLVEENVIWNCLEGIYAVADAVVQNNIIFGSGTGLSLYNHNQVAQFKDVTAVNNTIYDCENCLYVRWGGSNMILANNAIYCPNSVAVNSSSAVQGTIRSNFVEGAMRGDSIDDMRFLKGGSHQKAFVDPSKNDFWPKEGSPLVEQAYPELVPQLDFNELGRQSPFDVGAYGTDGRNSNPGWKVGPGFKLPPSALGELSITVAAHTPNAIDETWYSIDLPKSFPSAPIIVTSIETYDGVDTSGLRMGGVSQSGFQVKIEEEGSRDTETAHTTERIGYFASEAGVITDAYGAVIGEAGSISRRQSNGSQWHTVNLTEVHLNPVVIMNLVTYTGKQPTHVRLRNIGPSSFEFQLEEWDYLDGAHVEEQLHYLVLQSGVHELPGRRKAEVGTIKADHRFTYVPLEGVIDDPVVLSQSQTYNDAEAIVTRQTDADDFGFFVKVQEEEGNVRAHPEEAIGYFAVGQGR
jgi:hypothetical protein